MRFIEKARHIAGIMAALISPDPHNPMWTVYRLRVVYNHIYITYEQDGTGNIRHSRYQ